MRTPRRIEQRMYYSIPKGLEDVYELDENGEIVYRDIAGKSLPVKKGIKMKYSAPVKFSNSITSDLTADDLSAFGADNSGKKAKMTYHKSKYPFQTGTLIWLQSKVKYVDGDVDPTSADFQIVGIRNTGKHFWNALLSEVVK